MLGDPVVLATFLSEVNIIIFGLGGVGITYSPRDPRFAGSNPTEVDGFYIYIGSTQPRAVHPLPNAKDVYSPPYPLPCLCSS